MTRRTKSRRDRPPLTDGELERLTAYDFGKIRLTEDEKLRLRAINERRRQEVQRKEVEWARAEAPLVQELRDAGAQVSSVWDLVNAGRKRPSRTFRISTDPPEALWDWLDANEGSYASILPLLLDHLQRPYPDAIREGIARALAVPEARSAWPVLVKLYQEEQGGRTKDGLAVAVSSIVDDETLDELIELARNARHGESRVLLLSALKRSHHPDARKALMELGGDPELHKEVQAILRRQARS